MADTTLVNESPAGGGETQAESLLVAVKGQFASDFGGVRGVFLFVMDVVRLKTSRLYVIVRAGDRPDMKFDLRHSWKSLESDIVKAKLSGGIAQQMSLDVQAYLKRVLAEDIRDEMAMLLQNDNLNEARRIFEEIFSRALGEGSVHVDLAAERTAVAEVPEMQTQPPAPAEAPGAAEAAQPAEAAQKPAEPTGVRVKVEPVLSPVHGVPARTLTVGTIILVKIKEDSAIMKNLQALLAPRNRDVDEPGAVRAGVVSITPGEYERLSLLVELAKNVTGICGVPPELKIKTAVEGLAVPRPAAAAATPAAAAGPTLPTNYFLIAAIVMFLIFAVIAYFVFGML